MSAAASDTHHQNSRLTPYILSIVVALEASSPPRPIYNNANDYTPGEKHQRMMGSAVGPENTTAQHREGSEGASV